VKFPSYFRTILLTITRPAHPFGHGSAAEPGFQEKQMKRRFAIALVGMILALGGLATAAQKDDDNAKKIVGKWEITKSDSDLPKGSTVEFTKDGKMTALLKGDDLKLEGTYKVEKDKLTVKLKAGDQSIEETVTITKLTDDALELKDKDNKVDVFKKAK